jgi:DNA polymerase-2
MQLTGWFLDVYPDPQDGAALWLLDDGGARRRLRQDFPVTFYASAPDKRLRQLWRWLQAQPAAPRLARAERRDLFSPQPLAVLAIQVAQPAAQPRLFLRAAEAFPDVAFYDADLPLALHHAAAYGTFPLARCRLEVSAGGQVQALETLDTPWELDPLAPPLRLLTLEPDCDPFHRAPASLLVRSREASYRLTLEPARPLLVNLRAILERHDPDLLLTTWGDTWLLPRLLEQAEALNLPLPLNRDPRLGIICRKERSYFTYGQIIHRGQQIHLSGRWHIDGHNAMLYHDYGMEGIFELARVTALPVQTVARVSPGSGISAMQMLTALRLGVLVPWHKQQAESPKTALELMRADQGGLVYQPTIGLHRDVGEIDFISMYPSIMARFNISPETVGTERPTAELVPELGMIVDRARPGLVPQTLAPLLEKRLALKARQASLPAWDPRRRSDKARASAHKWLLVTCFGYLGYKNARFGRIEAHEAVTAYGREALLRAKEAAEDLGFEVLHMYVDGLWIRKPGASQVADFQPVLDEILRRTGLPIALDGIYRWVAFLPSRQDERVPVANRYFGVFQDGSLKMRGIELRRRDTPAYIAAMQTELLELLSKAPEPRAALPEAVKRLNRRVAALRRGEVPPQELLVSQKLSRELAEYRSPSPVARAVRQLEAAGKTVRPGQCVRFVYLRGQQVHAWDIPAPLNPASLDAARYIELLLRAAATLLQPLGVSEATLRDWLISRAGYLAPPGRLPERPGEPLFPCPSALRAPPSSAPQA